MSSVPKEDTNDQTILNDFDLCNDIDEYGDGNTTLSGIRDQEKNILLDQNKTTSRKETELTAKTREHTRLKENYNQAKKYFEVTVGKYETKIEEQLKEIQKLLYFEGQHYIQNERIRELTEQLQQSKNSQTELTKKLHDEESDNKSKEEIIQALGKENNSLKEEKLRDRKSCEDLAGKYETERKWLLKEVERLLYFEDQYSIQKECIRELNEQLTQSNNAQTELRNKLHRSECENKAKEEIIQALRKDKYSLEEEKKILLHRPKHNIAGSGHSTQVTSDTEYTTVKYVTILKDELHQLKQDKDDLKQKLLDQKKTTSRKETELTAKTREHTRLNENYNQTKKYFEVTVGKYETKIEEQLKEIQKLLYFEGQHSIQNERIQELKEQLQQSKNSQTELTKKLHDEESDNKSKEEIIQALGKENNSLKEEKLRDRKSCEDLAGKYETERKWLLKEVERLLYFEDQYSIQKECIRELNEQLTQSNNAQTELRNKLHRSECENKAKEEIIQALRKDKYSLEEEKKILLHRPKHNIAGSGHSTQVTSDTEYTTVKSVTILKDELHQLKQDKDDLKQKLLDQKKTTSRKETELTAKTREHTRLNENYNQTKKYFEVTVGKYETKIEEQLKEIQKLLYFEGQHSIQNERIQELKEQLQQSKNSQTELTKKLHDEESDNKSKEEIIQALGKENNSLKEEKLRDRKSCEDLAGKYETERKWLLKEVERLLYFEDQYSIQKECIRELNEQLTQSNNAQTELRNKLHRSECENKAKEEIIQALRKDKYSLEEEKKILLHRPKHNIAGSGHSTQVTSDTEYTTVKSVTILKDELHQLKQDKDDLKQKLLDQKKTTSRKETELTAKTREHTRLNENYNQAKKYFEVTVGKYETKIEEQLKEIQKLLYFEGQHSIQNERIHELKEHLQQSKNSQTELTKKLHDEESDNKSKEEIIQALGKENNSLKEEKLRDRKTCEDLAGKYEIERKWLLKEVERLLYFEDQYSIQKECIRGLNELLTQSNNAQTELRNILHRAECEKKAKEEIIQALRKDKFSLEEEKKMLSKMAGAKLTLDNPHIADLSDQKRPTKLAEEFAELYDNEWTDAFEDVKSANEQKKTTFMLKLLKRASEMCSEVSNEHMNGIKRSVCTLTVRTNGISGRTQPEQSQVYCDSSNLKDDQKKAIMDLRKFIEVSLSDQLEAVVADVIARENDIDNETPIAVFNYIKKCVNICWSMCRVEPPVFINFQEEQVDLRVDSNIYKAYTKTGNFVDYIVWPALYLHENGPLLCKGVAQGKA